MATFHAEEFATLKAKDGGQMEYDLNIEVVEMELSRRKRRGNSPILKNNFFLAVGWLSSICRYRDELLNIKKN